MGIFKNLTNDDHEEVQDRIGYQALPSGAYQAVVKSAYADQSKQGAQCIVFAFDVVPYGSEEGVKPTEYRETIYITNKQGQNWFANKQDSSKKVSLPGFIVVNDICLMTTEAPLSDQDTEEKVVKAYDPELKKETNKAVPMLQELVGKEIVLGIYREVQTANVKQGNEYVPDPEGKTRTQNVVNKVFHSPSGLTVLEAQKGVEEAELLPKWIERNTGKDVDRTARKDDAARDGRPGAPAAGDERKGARTVPALFGKK